MSSLQGRLIPSFEFEHSLEPCASLGHLVQSTTRRYNGCTKLLAPRETQISCVKAGCKNVLQFVSMILIAILFTWY